MSFNAKIFSTCLSFKIIRIFYRRCTASNIIPWNKTLSDVFAIFSSRNIGFGNMRTKTPVLVKGRGGEGRGRDVQRWSGSSRHQRDNARWWIRGISGPWKMYEVSGVGLRLAGSAGWDAGILTLWSRQLGYYIRDYVDFARIIITKCRWSSYRAPTSPTNIYFR